MTVVDLCFCVFLVAVSVAVLRMSAAMYYFIKNDFDEQNRWRKQ